MTPRESLAYPHEAKQVAWGRVYLYEQPAIELARARIGRTRRRRLARRARLQAAIEAAYGAEWRREGWRCVYQLATL